jgi:Domain of unknown function (DUF4926)
MSDAHYPLQASGVLECNKPPDDLRTARSTAVNDMLKLLDVVALLEDIPGRGLRRGQVGTVVEALGLDSFEVEFSDDNGRTYAQLALRSSQLIVLQYEPALAA